MAFDRKLAEGTVVEILDALNGDRVVGTGFRLLDDAIATSCQCLPRPRGTVLLPDPDAAGILALVRVRKPGTAKSAFGIVTAADPYSGLALLKSSTSAGLTVPDELNPIIAVGQLIQELEPAIPSLTSPQGGSVFICTHERQWLEGTVSSSTLSVNDGAGSVRADLAGAPVFDDRGRVVGLLNLGNAGPGLKMCSLADHLPGWALRKASEAAA